MNRILLTIFLTMAVLCMSALPAMAQYTTFIVDDDGNPLTTYPTLSAAIATAQTFAGGPHKIVIMAGSYSDNSLTPNPAKIDAIYGDSAAAPGDIVFTSPAGTFNFITLGLDQSIRNIKLVGYAGTGVFVNGNNVVVEDMIIEGASGTGVYLNSVDNVLVQNLALSNLDNGVYCAAASNTTIQNCDAVDCDFGAQIYNLTGTSWIIDFTALRGNYGIYVDGGSSGFEIQNARVDSVSTYGIYFNSVGGSRIENSLVNASGGWGIIALNSTATNWIRFNCLINNTGASQGYDDGIAANWWDGNFFGDNVYTMSPGIITDANPMQYALTAVAAAASYNIGDIIDVDFMWSMPACAGLDSQLMAAFNFVVNWDDTKLAYVTGSADYDGAYLGPSPPALYTGISETSNSLTFAAANFTLPGIDGGRLGFAQFEVIGANVSSAITFTGTDFRDPANNPIPHGTGSTSFTLIDNVAPVLVSAVANNPVGDDTYSDGSVAGPGPFVTLSMIMNATDNYDLDRIEYSYNGAPFGTWIPGLSGVFYLSPSMYAGGVAGLPEGVNNLALRAVDAAGLISNVIVYNFTVDRTAPVITSVAVSDKDGCALDNSRWTNDSTVTLAIAATGSPFNMMVSESGDKPIIAFAASSDFAMTNVNGSHTVYARLYDKYNNRVDWTPSNAIILDNIAPVAVGPLVINLGALKTSSASVAISWANLGLGGLNMGQANLSENAADLVCGNGGWVPNSVGPPWPFSLSAGDGMKTVYLAARDSAGNISNVLSDAIELDMTPVTITSYDMVDLGGFDCSDDGQIEAHYSWTGTDAVTLEWSYDGITWGFWKSLVGETSPDTALGSVPNVAGVQYLYIRIVDDIANTSAPAVDSIEVDNTVPTLTNMIVVDAAVTATPDPVDPQYSNSLTFNLSITGLSADVTVLRVSEDNFTTYSDFAIVSANPYTLSYTYAGTPTECVAKTLWIKALDCAGNESVFDSDPFRLDLTPPVLTSFTGPALTNVALVNLAIVATDNCTPYRMRIGEGSLVGVPWVAYNAAPTYSLVGGDGPHTVLLEVSDRGGNIVSGSCVINLDATVPSAASFVIVSGNPLAAPGYTSSLSGNMANMTWDGDVDSFWTINSDGSNPLPGWTPVSTPFALNPLTALGGVGMKQVNYYFKDGAGNVGGPYPATILYSNVPPPPPATATGTPSASCVLQWAAAPDGQKYTIRYNFQNQYPTYPDPVPPHPMDRLLEGILATDTVTGLTYEFDGPQPDIYSFSIWTLSNYGLYSATPNVDVSATNYILGDFYTTPDGCIKFGDEFGALAVAYNSIFGDPNFNQYLDIGPTIDATPSGYPVPDQAIDFEDLVIFALNYDAYFCVGGAPESPNTPQQLAKLKAGPLAITADIPDRVHTGDEFVIPIRMDAYDAVKAFHVRLNLNSDQFAITSVKAGSAFNGIRESFFYTDPRSTSVDVSGVIFGRTVTYTSDEIFTVTVKAKVNTTVDIEDLELTFRDRENKSFEASLAVNRIIGSSRPTAFALAQNYPNPFNPTTSIELALPVASEYTLTIYNVLGQEVKSYSGFAEAGYVKIDWNAADQASGIYLYKVIAGRYEETKKMVLLK